MTGVVSFSEQVKKDKAVDKDFSGTILATALGLSGANWADRLMESKTALIPIETTMRDDASRLAFQIGHHVLVAHVEDASGRQYAMPVCHEPLIATIVSAKLGQIVRVVLLHGEQL